MSAIRFQLWQRPGVPPRVYVNGHAHEPDVKVWLSERRGGTVTIGANGREAFGIARVIVQEALAAAHTEGQLPAAEIEVITWADVLRLSAAAPAPRPTLTLETGVKAAPQRSISGAGRSRQRGWRGPEDDRPLASAMVADLDPDAMKDPLPGPTVMLVDHREPPALLEAISGVQHLETRVESLEIGDYVVLGQDGEPALYVERKTAQDLVSSLVEDAKRLFHQTNAMRDLGIPGVLLLEGDVYQTRRTGLAQLTGTLSYLATIQRIAVVPTVDLQHSAYMLVKLARHAVWGLGYDLGLRACGPKDPRGARSYVLEGIPGVSATLALALLEHFGSVAAVAQATEAALRAVPGIGPTRARVIRETMGA